MAITGKDVDFLLEYQKVFRCLPGVCMFLEVMRRLRSSIRGGETEETIQRSPDDFGWW